MKDEACEIASDANAMLRIRSVAKRFGGVTAVDSLSLDIAAGEFFGLLGPSGCGKTTLLRMLAGFETPDAGEILLDGNNIALTPPHLRPVNMMFQNYALFPHLSVEGNISFGLKRAGLERDEITARVEEMIALARLQGLENRKPDQLSGGQRQRVALARSLARRPRVLLLDEPLAALDKKLREVTQIELKELQRRLGMTFIVVTHDQEEAMTLSDRIGVMNNGRLVQVGTPRDLYDAPNSRWVAGFVGDINLIEGRVAARQSGYFTISTETAGTIVASAISDDAHEVVCVAIRPEKIRINLPSGETSSANRISGELTDMSFLGGISICKVRLDSGAVLRVALPNSTRAVGEELRLGQRVDVAFSPDDVVVLIS